MNSIGAARRRIRAPRGPNGEESAGEWKQEAPLSAHAYLESIRQRLRGRKLDVFVCDLDGVVFEGSNFWLDLHLTLGTDVQALALAKQYLRSDYALMAQITVRDLWKTANAAPFERLVRERTYAPGIRDLLGALADRGVATCIISSGPYELASRAQRDCRIHTIFANRVEIREDRFTGALEIAVDDNRKGQVLADFLTGLHLDNPTVAVMGDTEPDAAMFDHADLCIAYDSSAESLLARADICLPRGEIPVFTAQLTEYLDALARATARPRP